MSCICVVPSLLAMLFPGPVVYKPPFLSMISEGTGLPLSWVINESLKAVSTQLRLIEFLLWEGVILDAGDLMLKLLTF